MKTMKTSNYFGLVLNIWMVGALVAVAHWSVMATLIGCLGGAVHSAYLMVKYTKKGD